MEYKDYIEFHDNIRDKGERQRRNGEGLASSSPEIRFKLFKELFAYQWNRKAGLISRVLGRDRIG
jgi:hypothetical protein